MFLSSYCGEFWVSPYISCVLFSSFIFFFCRINSKLEKWEGIWPSTSGWKGMDNWGARIGVHLGSNDTFTKWRFDTYWGLHLKAWGDQLGLSHAWMCLLPIGRVRKIAVEKGRPSTSLLITGVPPVTFCAGTSESDHSGTWPADFHWSPTWVVRLRGASICSDQRLPVLPVAGSRPAFFHHYFFAPSLLMECLWVPFRF